MKYAYMARQLCVADTYHKVHHLFDRNEDVTKSNPTFERVYKRIRGMWDNSTVHHDVHLTPNEAWSMVRSDICFELSNTPNLETYARELFDEGEKIPFEPSDDAAPRISNWLILDKFQRASSLTLEEDDVNRVQDHFTSAIDYSMQGSASSKATKLSDIDVSHKRFGVTALGLSQDLDRALGGGVGNGELLVFMGPPNRGKTSLLCYVGAKAADVGCNVLHVSLEIGSAKVASRYYQCLKRNVKDAANRIFIESYPPQFLSAREIRRSLESIEQTGQRVSYLVVDYAMLMVPSFRNRDRRFDFGLILQELRAIAIDKNIKVITAWQVNREGARQNTTNYTHAAESWELAMHADIIIGINQTDNEHENGLLRLKVDKQRESTSRPTISFRANLDTMEITPIGGAM